MVSVGFKLIAACGALAGSMTASAAVDVLNFSGLNGALPFNEQVLTYYDGGSGGLGSSGAPNYGITFGANAVACSDTCDTAKIPGGTNANALIFESGSGVVMDKASGFTTGLSLYYTSPFLSGVVDIYSGLNGAGTLLAQINLPTTTDGYGTGGCGPADFCPYSAEGINFSGTAKSVVFTGAATYIAFADITLGSSKPGGPAAAPEMDPTSAVSGLTLLAGALLVLRGRRRMIAGPAAA